jgi:hypothetical protein
MRDEPRKPKRVTAKVARTVVEIAIVELDTDGDIQEYECTIEEAGESGAVVVEIISVQSYYR